MKTWKQRHREVSLELSRVHSEKYHLNEYLENYIHELHKEIVELRTDEKLSKAKTNPDQMVKITPKRQTMKLRYLVLPLVIVGFFYVGVRCEATRIQQTCESDTTRTILNGTAYICVTADQVRDAFRDALAHAQRGD